MPGSDDTLLHITLDAAVPLWIIQFKRQPWPYLQERAQRASQMIAEHGDNILYKGKKKGDTAAAFNALAEGIAVLSFFPGGVKIFGRHWIAQHPEGAVQPVDARLV